MRTKRNIFEDLDWAMVSTMLLLMLFGWINIYAATYDEEHSMLSDFSRNHGKQLIWIGLALVIVAVTLLLDQRFFEIFAFWIYAFSIILLVAVLVIGSEVKGAQSWFVMGPISFQPSELAKFGTALALSKFLCDRLTTFDKFNTKLGALGIIFLPIALIMLQPDVGSTLVFISFLLVLYRQGLSGWWFIVGLAAIALFIIALFMKTITWSITESFILKGSMIFYLMLTIVMSMFYYLIRKRKGSLFVSMVAYVAMLGYYLSVDYLFDKVLKPHHQNRINELLGIVSDPLGAGYNVHQSMIAIGSGGFAGKGFLEGTQTRFNFVPEQSTDFIFCTVGEEWGFLGTSIVIALFVFLMSRIVWLAEKQRSQFARIYGYSVASILFLHFTINLGMTMGLAPVIGIPLPFFSYGGSSLWSFTILLAVFVKLDSERKYVLR